MNPKRYSESFLSPGVSQHVVDVTMGVEEVQYFQPTCCHKIFQFSPLERRVTARIDQDCNALIIVSEVGVFLKGIEGEGLDMKHCKSLRDRSKVMNYGFNLGYGN